MHICHEEIFALMQVAQSAIPGIKVLVNKLRTAFHKDRPHPTCNDKHLKAETQERRLVAFRVHGDANPHIYEEISSLQTFRCSCGEVFATDFQEYCNAVYDPEINSYRPKCPSCGATV